CVGIGDGLARLGGDEFAIIAADAASPEQAAAFARRIVEAFAQPFHIDGQEVINTISIGLATAPADGDSPRTLLRSADI
ncbi:diguanylate cyclase domain-containing protein, partial [Klebsiella aerogenes]|uniref:diguanylate cyclase domain-containing protein n=1 Tax=Klebsiella aerogenes TaxID=548 RepID=UPI0013D13D87